MAGLPEACCSMANVWNTSSCDPRNMIGDSILVGHDSKFRTKQIEACRVGPDTRSYVQVLPLKTPTNNELLQLMGLASKENAHAQQRK